MRRAPGDILSVRKEMRQTDIRKTAQRVLKERTERLSEPARTQNVGRAITEALAKAAVSGDIKAAQLLMELAGEGPKTREAPEAVRAAPVIVDARPE